MPTKFFDPTPRDERVLRHNQDVINMTFVDEQTWHIWRGGKIVDVDDSQIVLDFVTKHPRCFIGTNIPIPLLVVTVQTDERNPGLTDDTGLRRIFIPKEDLYITRGKRNTSSRYGALVVAMEEAGHPGELPAIDGSLWLKCLGMEDNTAGNRWPINNNQYKSWEMQYAAP